MFIQELLKKSKPMKFDSWFIELIEKNIKVQTARKIDFSKGFDKEICDFDEKKNIATFFIDVKPKYEIGDICQVISINSNEKEKAASTNLFLEITGIRIEYINNITIEDAFKCGFFGYPEGYEDYEGNWIDESLSTRDCFLGYMKDTYKTIDDFIFIYEFKVIDYEV